RRHVCVEAFGREKRPANRACDAYDSVDLDSTLADERREFRQGLALRSIFRFGEGSWAHVTRGCLVAHLREDSRHEPAARMAHEVQVSIGTERLDKRQR